MSYLAWTDSLPKEWKIKPLKAVADCIVSNVDKLCIANEEAVRLCNYTNVYNNEFITLSMDLMQATATPKEIAKFCLRLGDVIITKDSETWEDIGVPALVKETADDLICGYHLALIRPRSGLVGTFLFRCFQAKSILVQLELAANGVTRFGISNSEISSVMLPVAPLHDQQNISNYLDCETKRLDALVAAKERLLDLLSEKRHAVITHFVMHHLDSDVLTRRLKYVVRLRRVQSRSYEECRPYVGLEDIESWTGRLISNIEMNIDASDEYMNDTTNGNIFERDDVVFGKLRPYLAKAWVAEFPGRSTTELLIMQPIRVEPYFLRYICISQYFVNLVNSATFGSKMPRADWNFIGNINVPVPEWHEQQAIVDLLDQETAKLDRLRDATEHSIKLLKERRAALIIAAVTGQIDMEEMAA